MSSLGFHVSSQNYIELLTKRPNDSWVSGSCVNISSYDGFLNFINIGINQSQT